MMFASFSKVRWNCKQKPETPNLFVILCCSAKPENHFFFWCHDLLRSLKMRLGSCAKWLDDIKFQQQLTKGQQQKYIMEIVIMMGFLYYLSVHWSVTLSLGICDCRAGRQWIVSQLPTIISFIPLLLFSFATGKGELTVAGEDRIYYAV